MAHTPGPWTVRPWAEKGPWIVQRGGEGGFIVEGLDEERAKADAFLIHAAPEMLEALKELHSIGFGPNATAADVMVLVRQIADAAIAKAEGK